MEFDISEVDHNCSSEKFKKFSYLWHIPDFTPFIPENKAFQIASDTFNDGVKSHTWTLKLDVPPSTENNGVPTIILSSNVTRWVPNVLVTLAFLDNKGEVFCPKGSQLPTKHLLPSTIKCGDVFKCEVTFNIKKHLNSLLCKGNFRILLRMWELNLVNNSARAEEGLESKFQKPPSTFVQNFEQLFKTPNFSDVILRAQTVDIHAHKCVLAARSPVFETMFNAPTTEILDNVIEIKDFPSEVVKGMVEWIYTDKTEINKEVAIKYVQIADMYNLEGLRYDAEIVLASNLNLENALKAFECSIMHKNVLLKSVAVSFIAKNKNSFVENQEFLNFVHGNREALQEFLGKV